MRKRVKILLIDNYDSFTYNLYDYFLQLDTEVRVIRNDEISLEEFKELSFDALVLSPGPKAPKNAGLMMEILDYYQDKKPILGICLGHQAIGEYFGAKLKKAILPMHGKTSILYHDKHPVFKDLPNHFSVMRYHSLIIEEIEKTELKTIAETEKGEIMALVHKSLPIVGIQFHPESILTENGLNILNNWLEINFLEKQYLILSNGEKNNFRNQRIRK